MLKNEDEPGPSELHPMIDLVLVELTRAIKLSRCEVADATHMLAIGGALQQAISYIALTGEDSDRALVLWRAVWRASVLALESKLALPTTSTEESVAARDMCPRTLLTLADELDSDAASHEGDSVHDLPAWMRAVGRRYRRRAKLAHGGWAAMRANEAQKRGQAR